MADKEHHLRDDVEAALARAGYVKGDDGIWTKPGASRVILRDDDEDGDILPAAGLM